MASPAFKDRIPDVNSDSRFLNAPSDGLAELMPQETAAAFAASVLGPLRQDAELLDT